MAPSLNPEKFVQGANLPVDQNLLVKEARFCRWDYKKKDGTAGGPEITAIRLVLVTDSGEEHTQYYGIGGQASKTFQPSDDGKTLVGPEDSSLNKGSNADILMTNVVNSGFPANRLESGDISILDGLYAYFIAAPPEMLKRSGLEQQKREDGRAPILPIPSKIVKLPWENKGAVKAAPAAASGKPAAKKSPKVSDEVVAEAAEYAKGVVDEVGTITRKDLATRAFRASAASKAKADKDLAKNPNKNEIIGVIYKPEFEPGLLSVGLTLDGDEIKAA